MAATEHEQGKPGRFEKVFADVGNGLEPARVTAVDDTEWIGVRTQAGEVRHVHLDDIERRPNGGDA